MTYYSPLYCSFVQVRDAARDYYEYTATTKTSGAGAFEAGTDSYQIGAEYKYAKSFVSQLRLSRFDNPVDTADLEEYTLNPAYNFSGMVANFSVGRFYCIGLRKRSKGRN